MIANEDVDAGEAELDAYSKLQVEGTLRDFDLRVLQDYFTPWVDLDLFEDYYFREVEHGDL